MYSELDVAAEATKWIGYLEHKDGGSLGLYSVNVGKGGYTAFAEIVRQKCGRNLQGLPWCAIFVYACFVNVYGCERVKKLFGRPHAGTRVLVRRMRRRGLWRDADYTPAVGDVIFLANDGKRLDHCGIVVYVDHETVSSVDGNTVDPSGIFTELEGGAVALRERQLTDKRIIGYGMTGGVINGDN